MTTHVDVLIIGAGLSGIGAAAQLTRKHPERSFLVLERREASGGTWDLFRYPGVRSDSDMFTLGYRFKPWQGDTALADGESILTYVRETATEYGVDARIRYRHQVTRADWDSATSTWTVTADVDGEERTLTADFLWCCSGYYDYDEGYTPPLPGVEQYAGELVHPQHWPEDLSYAGRRVVIIGSGATAVTLAPAMAPEAEQVTVLQRSPTYILSLPSRDAFARRVARVLPEWVAYQTTRWKNILTQESLYRASQRWPSAVRRLIRRVNRELLPEDYPVDTHFNPDYDPWDQRLCLVPDADLFRAIRAGDVRMATDTIDTFTSEGVRLSSGEVLEADLVITATGLNLQPFGKVAVSVDGAEVKLPDTMAYKAMMLTGVPNFAFTIGYTNASWTLKADLVAEYVCRLLRRMDERGYSRVVPERDPQVAERPLLDLEAGYVLRRLDQLPAAGDTEPWTLEQNYRHDRGTLRKEPIEDGVLSFT